jgi:hypothetical protein
LFLSADQIAVRETTANQIASLQFLEEIPSFSAQLFNSADYQNIFGNVVLSQRCDCRIYIFADNEFDAALSEQIHRFSDKVVSHTAEDYRIKTPLGI